MKNLQEMETSGRRDHIHTMSHRHELRARHRAASRVPPPRELGARVTDLLARGQFLVDPGWSARASAIPDPLLVETVRRARRPLLPARVCGAPAAVVSNTRTATAVLGDPRVGFGPAGGLRRNFFGACGGRRRAGRGWPFWRAFSERMFGYPDCRPSPGFPDPFSVVQERLEARLGRGSSPPVRPPDFCALASVASSIVFGVDASDFLLAAVRELESDPCPSPGARFGSTRARLRAFVFGIVADPPAGCLVALAKGLVGGGGSATDRPGNAQRGGDRDERGEDGEEAEEEEEEVGDEDDEELAFQVLGWFTGFASILCCALPMSLALLLADADGHGAGRGSGGLSADAIREARSPAFDPRSEDTLLHAVALETLRLYNPIGVIKRTAVRPMALPDGSRVPAGVHLFLPFEAYLRDPECYPRPSCFRPGRWMRSENAGATPACQAVFSTGVRACPARCAALFALRCALGILLARYDYRVVANPFAPGRCALPEVVDLLSLSFAASPAAAASFVARYRRGV